MVLSKGDWERALGQTPRVAMIPATLAMSLSECRSLITLLKRTPTRCSRLRLGGFKKLTQFRVSLEQEYHSVSTA